MKKLIRNAQITCVYGIFHFEDFLMANKPTYEELEQRVKEFEIEVFERKQAEKVLKENELKLRVSEQELNSILHHSPDIIYRLNPAGEITYVNDTVKEYGYSKEDLIGKNILEFVHPDDREKAVYRIDERRTGDRSTKSYEIRLLRKDLDYVPFENKSRGFGDFLIDAEGIYSSGKPEMSSFVGTQGIARDIFERKQAEDALQKSEEKYRSLTTNIPDVTWTTDYEGKTRFISPNIEKEYGYTPEEIYTGGDSIWLGRIHPEDAGKVKKAFRKLFEEGTMLDVEYRIKGKDGEWIWLHARSIATYERDGVMYADGIFSNVTERKRALEALEKSEAQKKAILDASIDVIRLVDKDMKIIWANETSTTELKVVPEQLEGSCCYEAVAGRDTPCPGCPTQKALKSGKSEHAVIHQEKLEGIKEETYWDDYAVPIKNESGDIINLIQVSRNITEHQRTTEALRESETKFRTLFDTSLHAIALTDMKTGRFVEVNNKLCQLSKYTRDELIGKTTTQLEFYSEDDRNRFINELTNSKKVHGLEMDFQIKDGSIINTLMFAAPIQIGEEVSILTEVYNITGRKQLEAQLQQAQKMEALGTLAGGIAHDFNNLLMAIQGRTSIMLMKKDSSHPDIRHLKEIEDNVESAADLTRQLLGFARGGKYEVKPTDLNKLVKKQNRMFGRTKKQISIRGKYEKDLWSVEVDQGQIDQVLLNLYVNAWQAMPGGGHLYLETENVTLDETDVKPFSIEPGKYVKISVTDTGVGMDKATLEKIFEPFFTTKEMGRGTGLGLASAYGIIKNHGGCINVYGEKGHGTTFNIYLPASEKEVIEEKAPAGDTLRGTETVLFVDDEDMIIEIAEEMFEQLGYKVLIARSGKEAIETYEKNKDNIDIVLLDMIMPDMSGSDTYDSLKEIDSDIRVLLSSGYSLEGRATEILDRGCNGFIQKPFKMKELSRKLREILDEK